MQFSEVLSSLTQANGEWTTVVPEAWGQGRSVFGGLQTALALRAMRSLVPAEMPLRTLQTVFVGPVIPGPVQVRARMLRAGKNTIHVQADIVDGDQILCIVIGVFGKGRPSQVEVLPPPLPTPTQKPMQFPFVPGVTPDFSRYFSMRWLLGTIPYTGNPMTRAVIEVGLQDSAKTGEEHVVAIADAIPPVALSMLKSPVNGSSMVWMLEMLRDRYDDLPLSDWVLDAELRAARDGYTAQSVMVWGPGGQPAAISNQCMVVFG